MEQLGCHWTDLNKIWYLSFFLKICQEYLSFIKIWQWYRVLYMKTNVHFWSYLARFFLEWEMFQSKVVEKIKTHILWSVTLFFFKLAVYEIMWQNIAEPGRSQMTIWRTRIACRIPKTINTLRIFNTYSFSTAIVVTRKHINITLGLSCSILLQNCNILYRITLLSLLHSKFANPSC